MSASDPRRLIDEARPMTNPEAQGTDLLPQTREALDALELAHEDSHINIERRVNARQALEAAIQAEREQARREALEEASADLNEAAERGTDLSMAQRVAVKAAALRLLVQASQMQVEALSPTPERPT
jgi:hypothetical protein